MLYEEELSDAEKMKSAITKTHVLEEICTFVKQWVRQITMVSKRIIPCQLIKLLSLPLAAHEIPT